MKYLKITILLLALSFAYPVAAKCKSPYINDIGFSLGSTTQTSDLDGKDFLADSTTAFVAQGVTVSGEHCIKAGTTNDLFILWGVGSSGTATRIQYTGEVAEPTATGSVGSSSIGLRWKW